tara:strand:- start:355 stop:690 length:336 start_codon:yes stop_codon:yes gene_type:complete
MAVYVANIVINQGADFAQTYTLEDSTTNSAQNLTGYSVASKISKHHASTVQTAFSATVSNASGGEIKLTLTDTQTAALAPGRQVYDILLTAPDGTKERVIEGMALIRDGVT